MIVILGLDGLDPYLVKDFGFDNLTQNYSTKLKIPEDIPLHTEVIWPTIITGEKPEVHGLTRTRARKWQNPAMQALAKLADSLLPSKLLLPIGKKIQMLGLKRTNRGDSEYYNENDIETIFSNARSKVVGVPGYNPAEKTDRLRRLGGHSTHDPVVEIDELITKLEEEFQSGREEILSGLKLPVNILMVYIFSTDMVGHIFWDDMEFISSWYKKCDVLVQDIHEKMSDSDKLLVLSDHGMNNGKHRREAFFSCSGQINMNPSTVLDIKPFVDNLLSESKEGHAKVKDQLDSVDFCV